jgi:protein-arginine kinase activator protein McsA
VARAKKGTVMINIRICDYCGDRNNLHVIELTHKPNAETITAEICQTCLTDIVEYFKKNEIRMAPTNLAAVIEA